MRKLRVVWIVIVIVGAAAGGWVVRPLVTERDTSTAWMADYILWNREQEHYRVPYSVLQDMNVDFVLRSREVSQAGTTLAAYQWRGILIVIWVGAPNVRRFGYEDFPPDGSTETWVFVYVYNEQEEEWYFGDAWRWGTMNDITAELPTPTPSPSPPLEYPR